MNQQLESVDVELGWTPVQDKWCWAKAQGWCNFSYGELMNLEAPQGISFFGLDLLRVLARSDLHLRTLQD